VALRISQSNSAFQFNKPGTAGGSIYQNNFFSQGSIFTQCGFEDFFSRGCRNPRQKSGKPPTPIKPPVKPPSGDPTTPPTPPTP